MIQRTQEVFGRTLTLQLHFFEMSAARLSLVSTSPERPSDDACGLDSPLRELAYDATNFLN
jgi:hypothetical protein